VYINIAIDARKSGRYPIEWSYGIAWRYDDSRIYAKCYRFTGGRRTRRIFSYAYLDYLLALVILITNVASSIPIKIDYIKAYICKDFIPPDIGVFCNRIELLIYEYTKATCSVEFITRKDAKSNANIMELYKKAHTMAECRSSSWKDIRDKVVKRIKELDIGRS